MRYLMFAEVLDGGSYSQVVQAQDNDVAVKRMEQYLLYYHRIPASEIITIAGVWDKDPRFYTAKNISDIDD